MKADKAKYQTSYQGTSQQKIWEIWFKCSHLLDETLIKHQRSWTPISWILWRQEVIYHKYNNRIRVSGPKVKMVYASLIYESSGGEKDPKGEP